MACTVLKLLVCGIIAASFAVYEVSAIQCYECNSDPRADGKKCEEVSGATPKIDCSSKTAYHGVNDTLVSYTFCRKIDQTVEGKHTVIRQCAGSYTNPPEKCIQRIGTHKVKVFHCHCSADDCNSGVMLTSSLLLIALFTVLRLM